MISVLVVAHEPLATALIHCTRHVFGRLPSQVAAPGQSSYGSEERATAW